MGIGKGGIRNSIPLNGNLTRIYHLLFEKFGSQRWWPGETPFEVVIGAILTQNTAWTNVAKAIQNLKNAGCLDPHSLYTISLSELSELIRPSGFYKLKATRLKEFINHLFTRYQGKLDTLFSLELNQLRRELVGIKGIGPETADSIILYAANKPVFVVDAYTKRIFIRHGFFPDEWGYEDIQGFFMKGLPQEVDLYNEYHALIVRLAKVYCRKKPLCYECPLNGYDQHSLVTPDDKMKFLR